MTPTTGSGGSPTTGGSGSRHTRTAPRLSRLLIAAQRLTVGATHRLELTVECAEARCSGVVTLTVARRVTVGRRPHRRTRTVVERVGQSSFRGLSVGTHRVRITLDRLGVRLLRRPGRLHVSAIGAYASGSRTRTVHRAVLLVRAPPRTRRR